jgi:hypothetical protein
MDVDDEVDVGVADAALTPSCTTTASDGGDRREPNVDASPQVITLADTHTKVDADVGAPTSSDELPSDMSGDSNAASVRFVGGKGLGGEGGSCEGVSSTSASAPFPISFIVFSFTISFVDFDWTTGGAEAIATQVGVVLGIKWA